MVQDFLEGFKIKPSDIQIIKRAETGCPTPPVTTKVSAESRSNYSTLSANAASGYGMTGLMAMNTWQTACYGEVRPGYIFLFPGIRSSSPSAYNGTVNLNCAQHQALSFDSPGTLHQQMCDILGRPASDFIGFSCMYPYNGANKMGYHSWTCNPHWFNGSNEVPVNCNGVNWQQIIFNTMSTWIG
ncbi:hypothetical protein [Pontimicrobium aquaticum]|uniref:Uncharacterized protein n=1 Tax=Pontimicrobium aquaticum TaxID=2565367 RepID=A0A4U0ET68_9FLAO|nr:hypothetical protein [Pontimicrobium aquaticum]TJY34838.1 hypothetical protein E5167_11075 [Pontimicrobium aquaticum]